MFYSIERPEVFINRISVKSPQAAKPHAQKVTINTKKAKSDSALIKKICRKYLRLFLDAQQTVESHQADRSVARTVNISHRFAASRKIFRSGFDRKVGLKIAAGEHFGFDVKRKIFGELQANRTALRSEFVAAARRERVGHGDFAGQRFGFDIFVQNVAQNHRAAGAV